MGRDGWGGRGRATAVRPLGGGGAVTAVLRGRRAARGRWVRARAGVWRDPGPVGGASGEGSRRAQNLMPPSRLARLAPPAWMLGAIAVPAR
ncbi:hypothetical protein GCM10009665_74550 [Kitasatospora nipponensis]|uniref:Uncharacterized protein n=1 Tax=Kitasatospora nipponensis TaxID=258049 RepID=A0ABN1T7A1_9ACTN